MRIVVFDLLAVLGLVLASVGALLHYRKRKASRLESDM